MDSILPTRDCSAANWPGDKTFSVGCGIDDVGGPVCVCVWLWLAAELLGGTGGGEELGMGEEGDVMGDIWRSRP